MYSSKSTNRLLSLLLAFLLLTPALVITRQASAAPLDRNDAEQESLTLDSLLGADIYMLYGELRNVGAQAQAGGLMNLIEPLIPLLGGMPKELAGITSFISKYSSTLSRSRIILAAMPVKPELPHVIIAIEMASPDAAKEFEPEFRKFLTSIIADAAKRSSRLPSAVERIEQPVFAIKRAGALLIVTEAEFDIKTIRPDEGDLLSSNLRFQAARNRFYSEPLFIYFDFGLNNRALKQRYGSNAGEQSTPPPEVIRSPEPETPVIPPSSDPPVIKPSSPSQPSKATPKPSPPRPRKTRVAAESGKPKAAQSNRARSRPARAVAPSSAKPAAATSEALDDVAESGENQDLLSTAIMPLVIGGNRVEKDPDALAVALAYEADALIVRILIAGEPDQTAFAIPFLSTLVCGSPVAPEGASYLPADTEIFLTASVDLPQMFDLILSMRGGRAGAYWPEVKVPSDATIAGLEKKLGLKLKEEFLAAFGSEVAFGLPAQTFLPFSFSSPMRLRQTRQRW